MANNYEELKNDKKMSSIFLHIQNTNAFSFCTGLTWQASEPQFTHICRITNAFHKSNVHNTNG